LLTSFRCETAFAADLAQTTAGGSTRRSGKRIAIADLAIGASRG